MKKLLFTLFIFYSIGLFGQGRSLPTGGTTGQSVRIKNSTGGLEWYTPSLTPALTPTLWEVTHRGDSTDKNIEAAGFTINAANNYINTGGNYGLGIRTNNIQRAYFDTLGNFIVGQYLSINSGGNSTSIFMGKNSGNKTQTGVNNIAIGESSGIALTTGLENVLIGKETGWKITTAGGNVIIGNGTGSDLQTGNNNIHIGAISARGNATGSRNLSMGYNSLVGKTGHNYSDNSCLGYNTGKNIRSGGNNVCLGSYAGQGSTGAGTPYNLVSNNYSIMIGARTSPNDSTTNGLLNIGNSIFGIGLNATFNSVAYARIGINKRVPNFGFEVNGTFGVNIDSLPTGLNTDSVVMIRSTGQLTKRPFSAFSGSSYTSGRAINIYGSVIGLDTTLSLTWTNAKTIFNSAATSSANHGVFNVGSGGFSGGANNFTGSANGTLIAGNLASGSTSDLINLQLAGVSKFKVTSAGVGAFASDLNIAGFTAANGGLSVGSPGVYATNYRYDGASSSVLFGSSAGWTFQTATTSTNNIQIGSLADLSTRQQSAAVQIDATTKGFLPPRMTTTEKNAISSPAEGLIVYDLTLHKLCIYTGSAWETITSL